MSIVEDRLAALKGRVQLLEFIDWDDLDNLNIDQEFVTEIKAELAKRDLTLDQVADMRRPHIEKQAAESATAFARIRQQHAPGTHNKLFVITNRAQVRLDVIAMDTQTATQFAVRSGHVRAAENATVSQYKDGYVQGLKSRFRGQRVSTV